MILTTIDIVCRKWLLERNISIHYYFEALVHAATATQLLAEDTLQIINTVNLPVGDYGEVDLPDDFSDDLAVAIPAGQSLIKLPKQDWITPIRIHSTDTGDFVPYTDNTQGDNGINVSDSALGLSGRWSYYYNVDAYSGSLGRRYGANGGTMSGYQIVKERRQVQMTENFKNSNVVLMYISDGNRADNASQIDTKASLCIRSYIDWQRSPNATNQNSPEGRTFFNQKRRLKSLLNQLTKTDVINILRQGYSAAIKN